TKAAAGLATAALLAGGAAEVEHLAGNKDPGPKPAVKTDNGTKSTLEAVVVPPPPPPATAPAPAEPVPAEAPTEVVVDPVPATEEELATDPTGGLLGPKTRKRRDAIADSDGSSTTPTTAAPPVATTIEQTTCDANGDGVADANCTGGTVATIEQLTPPPEETASERKRSRAGTKSKGKRRERSAGRGKARGGGKGSGKRSKKRR
ncbi:MAG: hypothetical protein ACRDKH_00680, partial [Solirubrobacterales bacterium]